MAVLGQDLRLRGVRACVFAGVNDAQASPGDPGMLFIDNPALVNLRPLHVDSWTRSNDDALRLHFALGSPDCNGVHATVQETPATVTVALFSGTLPEAVGRMCTMIAVLGTMEVPLHSPLGDRAVSVS